MSLSAVEFDAILHLVSPLPPVLRDEFLSVLDRALDGCERGPGIAHRTAVRLLPGYYKPPEPSAGPSHYNVRKLAAGARRVGLQARRVRRHAL
jgi:hypothetical protein